MIDEYVYLKLSATVANMSKIVGYVVEVTVHRVQVPRQALTCNGSSFTNAIKRTNL